MYVSTNGLFIINAVVVLQLRVVEQSDYFTNAILILKTQRKSELARIGTFLDADESSNYPLLSPSIVYNANENSLG